MAILVQSNKKPSVSFPSQTGSIIAFNSQYAGLPLKSCKVNIPVTQEGTGDPSPDNVRNFVGVSSLDFTANSVVKTFQFGQTIYAGELDVLTGALTITHHIVDLGSFNWISENSALAGMARVDQSQIVHLGAKYMQIPLCSQFKGVIPKYYTSYNDGEIGFSNSEQLPFIRVRSAELVGKTNSEIKAIMAGVMFVYELAEPEVINLGGMEIATLQGENNLFASTGETTVQYIKIGG